MKQLGSWPFVMVLCLVTNMLLFGCGHSVPTDFALTTKKIRAPILPDDVKIYENAANVPGRYEEMGIVTAHDCFSGGDLYSMSYYMREKAAKFGANGIIFNLAVGAGDGTKIVGRSIQSSGAQCENKGTAIYVFPENMP